MVFEPRRGRPGAKAPPKASTGARVRPGTVFAGRVDQHRDDEDVRCSGHVRRLGRLVRRGQNIARGDSGLKGPSGPYPPGAPHLGVAAPGRAGNRAPRVQQDAGPLTASGRTERRGPGPPEVSDANGPGRFHQVLQHHPRHAQPDQVAPGPRPKRLHGGGQGVRRRMGFQRRPAGGGRIGFVPSCRRLRAGRWPADGTPGPAPSISDARTARDDTVACTEEHRRARCRPGQRRAHVDGEAAPRHFRSEIK